MKLGNMKTRTKILLVVGIMASVTIGVSVASYFSLKSLSDATDEMELAASEAVLGAEVAKSILTMNRAEFRIAADPTGENYAQAKEVIERERKKIVDTVAKLKATADEIQAQKLADVEAAFSAYSADVDDTIRVADKNSAEIVVTGGQKEILASVISSRAKATVLEESSRAFVDFTVEKSVRFSREATSTYETVSFALFLGAAIGMALGVTLGLIVSQVGIVGPIRQVVASLMALSKGDMSASIYGAERGDEVGDLGKTARIFKESLIEADRLRSEQRIDQEKQLARGNTIAAAVRSFDSTIREIVGSVDSAATELRATAESLSATAEETSRQSTVVAASSEQTKQNVNVVAAATEELASSIQEIGSQVAESTRIVSGAVAQAGDTDKKVKALSEAAQKIGDVVTLINEIAGQTNLLALNATIEAARAGDAGKGFAVVAAEVKQLAAQTARATEEISSQVRAIQEATHTSAQAIGDIVQTIDKVNEISTSIASAVVQQGVATQEISRSVSEVSVGTAEISSNIAGVSEASQITSAGSTQIVGAASELAENGERLKTEVERFLQTVRAA